MTAEIDSDSDTERQRAKCRTAVRREFLEYIAGEIRVRFPLMPPGEAEKVAAHAFKEKSGRVGEAPELTLDERIDLAVEAYVRHRYTDYDDFLWNPHGFLFGDQVVRAWANEKVLPRVQQVCCDWKGEAVASASDSA